MRPCKGYIEARVVRPAHAHHGRQHERRMAEQHREHEAQRDRVQRSIPLCMPGREGTGETQQRANGQPAIVRQKTHGDEAHQSSLSHRVAGDVMARERRGQRQQSAGDHMQGAVGPTQCTGRTGKDDHDDDHELSQSPSCYGQQSSPAMVRIRNDSHHCTAADRSPTISHTPLPAAQQTAAPARTTRNHVG